MDELGELLVLLHGARDRWRTARGVLRLRTHRAHTHAAHERWRDELERAGASGGTAYAIAFDPGPAEEVPDVQEFLFRFWSEPPDRMREEGPEHVTVRDGRRWWTYSPSWGAISNVGPQGEPTDAGVGGGETWEQLLDPAPLLPGLAFEPVGETTSAGRAALRVRASPRPVRGPDGYLHRQLGAGADAYELLVDRERGVLLRAAALLDGEEFSVSELEELSFDEDFAPETFVFVPPPGVEVRPAGEPEHEQLTIEQAAERASFPLFAPPGLPEGRWQLHASYFEAREQPRMEEAVFLAYHRADARHSLMLSERPAGDNDPEWVRYDLSGLEVEQVERGGRVLAVYRPAGPRGMPLTVVHEREGTRLELSSQDLDEETLLDLAAALERIEV